MFVRSLVHRLIFVLILNFIFASAHAEYRQPVVGQKEMVVTAQHLATQVGIDVLNQGGNAIDAAVAVGYALAVVLPCCGNIGGGGFMTIHLANGKDTFINFREKAPLAATPNMYLDKQGNVVPGLSTKTYLAVGVPGTVLGLETALQTYGTMKREQVLAPAIRLAEDGFLLSSADAAILASETKAFRRRPNVASIFLKQGRPYRAGERLVQKDLARTLKMISESGADAFYKGSIAKSIVRASEKNGGILSEKDFHDYTVQELQPIRCKYRSYEIVSAPPPSSGGTTLCLILNILEGYPIGSFGFNSAKTVHYMVEAMRHAYADRNYLLGDPDFLKNPIKKLLSESYAASIRKKILPDQATPSAAVVPDTSLESEGTTTTHYSIRDRHGNTVAVTFTLNSYFGVKEIAGNTGFFLNNEMNDFTEKPGVPNMFGLVQGKNNGIEPGKRPLSSMSPTIVKKSGRVFLVLGSPGGSRIITIVAAGIMNVIDFQMNLSAAVNSPRIHHQWLPDLVYFEPRAFTRDTANRLEEMGYELVEQRPWGALEAIMVVPKGMIYGVNDNRRPAGKAMGQ